MLFNIFSDRVRTQCNVMSDGFGCAIVEKLVQKHLTEVKEAPNEEVNNVQEKDDTDVTLRCPCNSA